MAYRIDDFKSLVSRSGGLARPNMFRVFLPSLGNGTSSLNLLCTSAELPGRQIMSTEQTIGTVNRRYASGYATTDVTLNFYVMNDHAVKNYFETWQSLVHSQQTYEVNYYNNYVKPVIIQHLQRGVSYNILRKQLGFVDRIPNFLLERLPDIGPFDFSQGEIQLDIGSNDTPVYTCLLQESYPTTMNAIQLGDAEDGVMQLSVQLTYKDWISGRAKPNDNLADSILGFGIRKIIDFFD